MAPFISVKDISESLVKLGVSISVRCKGIFLCTVCAASVRTSQSGAVRCGPQVSLSLRFFPPEFYAAIIVDIKFVPREAVFITNVPDKCACPLSKSPVASSSQIERNYGESGLWLPLARMSVIMGNQACGFH